METLCHECDHMIDLFAAAVVLLTGLYFIGLALAAFFAPALAARFLLGFVKSAFSHYLELGLRLAVGGALVLRAPNLQFAGAFAFIGWVILITTAVLFCIPWTLHRRFAQRAVPRVIPFLKWLGIVSMALGMTVLYAVIRGAAE